MENGNTYQELKKIIERYASRNGTEPAVSPDSTLDDLGIDSPRRIDILLDTEDKFNISIQDNQFDQVKTFGDLVRMVESMTTPA